MGEEAEEIREDENQVEEETTPETDEEAVEQRTDDYEGLARRIDDLTELVRSRLDSIADAIESLSGIELESGARVGDGTIEDEIEDAVEDALDLEKLDLL